MENLEFLEPHAVCGFGGQQWPIEEEMNRDKIIAQCINQTKKELSDE